MTEPGGAAVDPIAIVMASTFVLPVAAAAVGILRVRRLGVSWALPWWLGALTYGALAPLECGAAHTQPPVGFCSGAVGVGINVDGAAWVVQPLGGDVALVAAFGLSTVALAVVVVAVLVGNRIAARRGATAPPTRDESGAAT